MSGSCNSGRFAFSAQRQAAICTRPSASATRFGTSSSSAGGALWGRLCTATSRTNGEVCAIAWPNVSSHFAGRKSGLAAIASTNEMIAVLDKAGVSVSRLLHGSNATAWGMMDEAALRGYDTRAGLEDTLTMPDGAVAADNAEIVTEARRRVGRLPA